MFMFLRLLMIRARADVPLFLVRRRDFPALAQACYIWQRFWGIRGGASGKSKTDLISDAAAGGAAAAQATATSE